MNDNKLDQSNVEDIVALTPMQLSMLFAYLENPKSSVYFEQISVLLTGAVDISALNEAWSHVTNKNEALRSVFRWEGLRNPVQVILKNKAPVINYHSMPEFLPEIKENVNEQMLTEDLTTKIDLIHNLFEIDIFALGTQEHLMIIRHHHILCDGWSNSILLNEFVCAYEALCRKEHFTFPYKAQYKEFVKYRNKQNEDSHLDYWKQYLRGATPTRALSAGMLSYSAGKQGIVSLQRDLKIPLTADLNRFGMDNNVTTSAVLYLVGGILMLFYSDTKDVLIGTTVSGRPPSIAGIEQMVGLCINSIPLRIQANEKSRVYDLLMRIRRDMENRSEHIDTSYIDIRSCMKVSGKEDLFDSLVAIENYPWGFQEMNAGGQMSAALYGHRSATNFPLTVEMALQSPVLVKYISNGCMTEKRLLALHKQFEYLLEQVITQPQRLVCDLQMLTPNQMALVTNKFCHNRVSCAAKKELHTLIEEKAEQIPDKTALYFSGHSMSYRELNQKANRVAWYLKYEGVGENCFVGLAVQRSMEMLIGVLGIIKAGAAYVPIDLDYPQDRISYMLADADVDIILTQTMMNLGGLKSRTVSIGRIIREDYPICNIDAEYNPERIFYLLYTSGSTGRPKGVMIKASAFVNLVMCMSFRLDWMTMIVIC